MCLIASFYLVDTRHGAEAPAAGMLDFSLTGQEVSRRGSVGSDDNGHTTVVSLRADRWVYYSLMNRKAMLNFSIPYVALAGTGAQRL